MTRSFMCTAVCWAAFVLMRAGLSLRPNAQTEPHPSSQLKSVHCAQCHNGVFEPPMGKITLIENDDTLRSAYELQGGLPRNRMPRRMRSKWSLSTSEEPLVASGIYKGKGQCRQSTLDEVERSCMLQMEQGQRCEHTKLIEAKSTHFLKNKLLKSASHQSAPDGANRLWAINTSYAIDGAKVKLLDSHGVYLIENFLQPFEADQLANNQDAERYVYSGIGCPVLRHLCYDKRFLTFPGNHCELRTSSSFWHADDDPLVRQIRKKIEMLTFVPEQFYESTQTTIYQPGQFFSAHYDEDACQTQVNEIPEDCALSKRRMITVLSYLNDPDQGGATFFPDIGLRINPKKGTAVLFFPVYTNGLLNPFTRHAGEEAVGNKMVMQQWISLEGSQARSSFRN